jgi:hypothetical protein
MTTHHEVRARAFVLEDADGKERARLEARKDGGVALNLFKQNELPAILLTANADGSAEFSMVGPGTMTQVWITIDKDGEPSIEVTDKTGTKRGFRFDLPPEEPPFGGRLRGQ